MNANFKSIVDKLIAIGSVYNPAVGLAAAELASLFEAGAELNGLTKAIRDQTEANAPEVLREVEADYAASVSAFEESVRLHPGR
jgi:hypothetical protein